MNQPGIHPASTRPRLGVLIACYDEAPGVTALVAGMQGFADAIAGERDVEIVYIDDGSRDGTGELLRAATAASPHARVVAHDDNRGLTAALATGLEALDPATELVGWLDADLTYDPAILADLAAAVDDAGAPADVALASPYHPGGAVEGVPAWRLWLSSRASSLYRRVTGVPIHTFTCMVRVQRRALLAQCVPERGGFVGITEILLRMLRRGARVVERPAVMRRRRLGQSKMRVLRVAFGHLGLMWAWRRGRL